MATAKFLRGDTVTIEYTATGAVAVDEIRVFGGAGGVSVGVARVALTTGDVGIFDIGGSYTFPAVTGAVIAAGQTVDWDSSAGKVDDNAMTATTGDVTDFAVALESKAAAATATTIKVKLLPGNGSIT